MSDASRRWHPAYIGLGSNLEQPEDQVRTALKSLAAVTGIRLMQVSALYRSAPLGDVEQPDFVNAVAAVLTTLEPNELLLQLQTLERRQGRQPSEVRWGPRVLDLDLLVYAGREISEPALSVPHPGIAERNFVLLPLREIAPDLNIPGLGRVSRLAVSLDEPPITRID